MTEYCMTSQRRLLMLILFSVYLRQHPSKAFSGLTFSTTVKTFQTNPQLRMSTEEETDYSSPPAQNNGILSRVSGMLKVSRPAKFQTPSPPEYTPCVDEQLERDLMESERIIQLLEHEIQLVRELLEFKEDELLEEQNRFREERRALMKELDDFSNEVAKLNESSQYGEQESSKQQQEREMELSAEIKLLSDNLEVKSKAFLSEKESARILKEQLNEVQDALTNETERFASEKKSLELSIKKEQKKVGEIKEQFFTYEEEVHKLKEKLEKQVEMGKEKVDSAKQGSTEIKSKLLDVEATLQASPRNNKEIAKQNIQTLILEKKKLEMELDELKESLVQEQASSRNITAVLKQRLADFQTEEEKLRLEIKEGQIVIAELETKIQEYKDKSKNEIIAQEATRLQELEKAALVNQEKAALQEKMFSEETRNLKTQYAEVAQLLKETKQEMAQQSSVIQQAMAKKLEKAESEARSEETRMIDLYEGKLSTEKSKTASLHNDLCRLKLENEELSARICEVESQKNESRGQIKNMELKYKAILKEAKATSQADRQKERALRDREYSKEMKSLKSDIAKATKLYEETKDKTNHQSIKVRLEMAEQLKCANNDLQAEKDRSKERSKERRIQYEKNLAEKDGKCTNLEDELCKSKLKNEELMASLLKAQHDKDVLITKAEDMHTKYAEVLKEMELTSMSSQEEIATKEKYFLEERKRLEMEVCDALKLCEDTKELMKDQTNHLRIENLKKMELVERQALSEKARLKDEYGLKLIDNQSRSDCLNNELCKLKLDNAVLMKRLLEAESKKEDSDAKFKTLQHENEQFVERLSLLNTEFGKSKSFEEDLGVKLNEATSEKEDLERKFQQLAANYRLLWNQNAAANEAAYQKSQYSAESKNFNWATNDQNSNTRN